MFNIFNMLMKVSTLLNGETGKDPNAGETSSDWYNIIGDTVDNFIGPILIILCSIGIIYAVVVGVKMIKAEDKAAREENKARLVNIAITIVAIVALIALFYALRNWISKPDNQNTIKGDLTNTIGQSIKIWFKK